MCFRKSKKLQLEIDKLRKQICEFETPIGVDPREQMMARCARLGALNAELAEISTRRIVRLTWALVALTAALLIYTIFLYKDTHQLIQSEKQAQDHSVQKP